MAILDADKEGFLRSATSLIQTFGRAARHVEGRAILYADVITDSIKAAVAETGRRRDLQARYNADNGITPQSIRKRIEEGLTTPADLDYFDYTRIAEDRAVYLSPLKRKKKIDELDRAMKIAARDLDFEKAAGIRDEIARLKKAELEL